MNEGVIHKLSKNNTSLVTKKTLNLLMLFAKEKELSAAEIATLLDINISSVYRIVNTMEEMNFLVQKGNKKYSLVTTNILQLYNMVSKDVRDFAKPVIEGLVERFRESVYMSEIYENKKVIIIEKQDSPNHLKWTEHIGSTYDIPIGTAGKTHLAYLIKDMDESERERFLSSLILPKFTDKSITNLNDLKKSINQILRDGYCITQGEHVEGIVGISVPVFNLNNDSCRNVMTMVMPVNNYDPNMKDEYITAMKAGALKISKNLFD